MFHILEDISPALQSVAGTIIESSKGFYIILSDQLLQGDRIHGKPSARCKQESIPAFHLFRLLNELLNQRNIMWNTMLANPPSTKVKYKTLRSIKIRGVGGEETFKNVEKKWSVIQGRRMFQKLEVRPEKLDG